MVDRALQRFGIALILVGGFLDLSYAVRLNRTSESRILLYVGRFVVMIGFVLTIARRASGD